MLHLVQLNASTYHCFVGTNVCETLALCGPVKPGMHSPPSRRRPSLSYLLSLPCVSSTTLFVQAFDDALNTHTRKPVDGVEVRNTTSGTTETPHKGWSNCELQQQYLMPACHADCRASRTREGVHMCSGVLFTRCIHARSRVSAPCDVLTTFSQQLHAGSQMEQTRRKGGSRSTLDGREQQGAAITDPRGRSPRDNNNEQQQQHSSWAIVSEPSSSSSSGVPASRPTSPRPGFPGGRPTICFPAGEGKRGGIVARGGRWRGEGAAGRHPGALGARSRPRRGASVQQGGAPRRPGAAVSVHGAAVAVESLMFPLSLGVVRRVKSCEDGGCFLRALGYAFLHWFTQPNRDQPGS